MWNTRKMRNRRNYISENDKGTNTSWKKFDFYLKLFFLKFSHKNIFFINFFTLEQSLNSYFFLLKQFP